MKYTIMGFSQEKLIKYDLDSVDAIILRWFVDFRGTNGMVEEIYRGKVYYWIDYKTLIDDIPIIRLTNKIALRRRLKKLVDKEILTHYTKKIKGTYSFYNLGRKYTELVRLENTETQGGVKLKSLTGQTQKFNRLNSKVYTKDSSTKDSSTKKESTKQQQPKNNSSKKNENKEKLKNNENKEIITKTKKNDSSRKNENNKKEQKQQEVKNIPVSDIEQIEKIQVEFEKLGTIGKKKVATLIGKYGQIKVKYYLENFDKLASGYVKNPVGFLIRAIENDWKVPEHKVVKNHNKPIQSTNFDQRQYDDDFFESLYED